MYWDVAFRLRYGLNLNGKPSSVVVQVRTWLYNSANGIAEEVVHDEYRFSFDRISHHEGMGGVAKEVVEIIRAWAELYTPAGGGGGGRRFRAEYCAQLPDRNDVVARNIEDFLGVGFNIARVPMGWRRRG